MPFPLLVKWVRAIALSALLLVPQTAPGLATAAVAGTLVFATPDEAQARSSSSSSSGGYSRSSSSSSRTPSVSSSSSSSRSSSGSSGYSRSSSSSSSGGYSRTPTTSTTTRDSGSSSSSASDKAFSRQGSSDALKAYRESQTPKTTTTTTTTNTNTNTTRPNTGSGWSWGGGNSGGGGSTNWNWGSGSRRGSDTYRPPHGGSWSGWYGQRGWTPPAYVNQGRGFGIWEGVALYFLLDTLTSPGHAAFFHNHQSDPGLQEWRAEAEKLARDNAELKAKLASLDKSLAQMKGQPVDPEMLPLDIPVEVVTNKSAQESVAALRAQQEGGGGWFWIIVVLAAVIFLLWLARRSLAARKKSSSSEDESVRLGTIGNYVSQKLSGKPYEPKLFRVGMAVTIDPTPFLLATDLTKVTAPEAGLTSIPAIGTVSSGSAVVHRLYLPESNGFFQLHLDKEGFPVECRYFTVIDEVNPADEGEWGFWLDKAEGAIGWPDFQTKDGKVYPRAWSPGASRIQPFKMREEMKDRKGTTTRSFEAMLYAAPTGAAASAPQSEYILVTAVEADGQAWVEVAAGIDVSPASLSLT